MFAHSITSDSKTIDSRLLSSGLLDIGVRVVTSIFKAIFFRKKKRVTRRYAKIPVEVASLVPPMRII